GLEEAVGPLLRARAHLPDPDAVIRSGGGEAPAVRAEGDAVDLFQRLREGVEPRAGRHLPELHRPVAARAREDLPVAAEGQLEDRRVVAGERPERAPALDVPEGDALVIRPGGEDPAIGREDRRIQAVLMAA